MVSDTSGDLLKHKTGLSMDEIEEIASMRAKEEFLSRIRHEIGIPINTIIEMTALAQKAKNFDCIHYCLDQVENASRQLLSLIDDIWDMSQIDSCKLEIVKDEFDFEQMMQYVFKIIQVKLEEKHQNFVVDFSSVFTRAVISDELCLAQVMIDLLTNAIKLTPHGGEIALHIFEQPLDKDQSRLRIEVSDNGIGVAHEHGETGLGLAACKEIINLLGGNIWMESAPGQGSGIFFEIAVEWGRVLLEKQ